MPRLVEQRDVPALVDHLFRAEAGRLVAVLTRLLGPANLELAEDVTQEALVAALHHWPRSGVPANPSAWLLQVARRKALDVLRREQSFQDRAGAVADELESLARAADLAPPGPDDPLADDQLRMILLCCHPAISHDSRVALTLKVVSGFSVREIARAWLADEAAIAQRIGRAKRALREANAVFEMPAALELRERLDGALDVLYLMFNEGHTAHEGDQLLKRDLCFEALRLAECLARSALSQPRFHALAAMFCFHASRLETRTDHLGGLVRLEDQDRSRWDRGLIARGMRHLEASAAGDEMTSHHLEAEIAASHALAPTWKATDWRRILSAYDRLVAIIPSPVVALNRAVAVAEVEGPAAGLEALKDLDGGVLNVYYLYHGVRGNLLAQLGKKTEAVQAYRKALALATLGPVRDLMQEKLDQLGDVHSAKGRSS